MTEVVVQTHQLTKHYHHSFFWWQVKAKALTDLTLQIERGQVFGLLGPNGSGKSTTIKLMLGLIFPSAGHVTVFGKSPRSREVKQRIGYLPEESYLYRTLDAQETLDFYARLFGLDRKERAKRVDSLLDLVGLSHVRHRPVVEFSKGMQRRIGLAQCLISDPEFVILDEPTTGLDPIGTAEFKGLIRQLRDKGKTVLLCSHLLSDVEDVCDRACILYGGQKRAEGSIDELVRDDKRLQVTAAMSNDTLSAVRALIEKQEGPESVLEAGPTKRRLENYFLDIVENAQSEQVQTSGARSPAQQSLDFLTEDKRGQAMLNNLAQADPAPVTEPAPKAESAPAPELQAGNTAVLESLTGASEAEPQAEPQAKNDREAGDARSSADTDHSLLENLSQGARTEEAAS